MLPPMIRVLCIAILLRVEMPLIFHLRSGPLTEVGREAGPNALPHLPFSFRRVHQTPEKQHAARTHIPNKKDERMVGAENRRGGMAAISCIFVPGSRRRLGAFFVHLSPGFVEHTRN